MSMSLTSPQTGTSHGYSLIELMVATTISLVVLSGLSFVLTSAYKTYKIQSSIQSLDENGRIGLERMARDIRMAGYVGCSGAGINLTNNLNTDAPRAIKGFENPNTSSGVLIVQWLPADASDPPPPNSTSLSDALIVTYSVPTEYVIDETTGTGVSVRLNSITGISVNDILLLSNCKSADLLQVSSINSTSKRIRHEIDSSQTPGNLNEFLGTIYQPNDQVLRHQVARYFIAEDVNNNLTPTLFRAHSYDNADAVAYIPGVENMQILYGEDTSNDNAIDAFRPAHQVADWGNVGAVKVALLMRSESEYGTVADADTDDIWVLDYEYDPDNSRFQRNLYTTTIQIRNY